MDQETKQQNADTTTTNTNMNPDTNTSSSTGEQSPSFDQLMQRSPSLSPFCGWLKCLRAPALSMQYSIQKRHVPDLDAKESESKANTKQTQSIPTAKGQNSDVMDVTGGFTIRYFDFALGVLGLMVAGCLFKGCLCLKRHMR